MKLTRSLVLSAFVTAWTCFTCAVKAGPIENAQKPTLPTGFAGEGSPQSILRPHFGLRAGSPPAGSTGSITPLIGYTGGSVIQNPVVYVIWYGNWNSSNGSDTPGGQQIVRDFLNSLGGSHYFDINQTYSTNAYSITGNLVFGGECSDTGSVGLSLSDAAIFTIVNNALNNTTNGLPYNPNGIYLVLTSSFDVTKSGFCTSYCGWHTSRSSSKGLARYSWVGNANKCLANCSVQYSKSPNGNPGVDAMISIIAHELCEATTDPDPFRSWADANNAENADKCAWTFGSTSVTPSGAYYNVTLGGRNYLLQRNLIRNPNGNTYCVLQ